MARSPLYVTPPGREGMCLAGVGQCGCVTAALSIGSPDEEDWVRATEKDVRDFYVDMGKSGRGVEWMTADAINSRGIGCKCVAKAASSS